MAIAFALSRRLRPYARRRHSPSGCGNGAIRLSGDRCAPAHDRPPKRPAQLSPSSLKQLFLLSGIAALVAAGAELLPFFAVSAAVAFAALLVTPIILGRPFVSRPAFQWAERRTPIRATVPLAITVALNLVYFRVIIILMSLLASAVATGLFATSFRVVEILIGAASVGVSVVMPVLAITANAEPDRLLYMLRRMLEMAILSSSYLIVVVIVSSQGAVSSILQIGGSPYRSAAGVLRIQIFVLIPVFCGQVLQVALIALRRQSAQALATGLALLRFSTRSAFLLGPSLPRPLEQP